MDLGDQRAFISLRCPLSGHHSGCSDGCIEHHKGQGAKARYACQQQVRADVYLGGVTVVVNDPVLDLLALANSPCCQAVSLPPSTGDRGSKSAPKSECQENGNCKKTSYYLAPKLVATRSSFQ